MSDTTSPQPRPADTEVPPAKKLTPEAARALAEAQARRDAYDKAAAEAAALKEIDGRGGLEPVRYGDWEIKGLASDF